MGLTGTCYQEWNIYSWCENDGAEKEYSWYATDRAENRPSVVVQATTCAKAVKDITSPIV